MRCPEKEVPMLFFKKKKVGPRGEKFSVGHL